MYGATKFLALYDALVANGTIKEVPRDKESELRERFISFYSRYDARLKRIKRERVHVMYQKDGRIFVTCVYYNTAYGQVYND